MNKENATGKFYWRNNTVAGDPDSYSDLMVLDNNAYLGIGTSSPDAHLEVSNKLSADTLFHVGTKVAEYDSRIALTETDNNGMMFEYDGVANIGYIGMAENVVPDGAWSKRITMNRTGSDVLFMAGNVGIGEGTPGTKLQIPDCRYLCFSTLWMQRFFRPGIF